AAADRRADQPEPHRLDRRKRPRRALLPDRRQLPDRRNRSRDRGQHRVVDALGVGFAALALLALGTRRERRGGAIALVVGLGVLALAGAAALGGEDYVVERNLLPALVPLAAVAAPGLGASRARPVGVAVAVALCAYWIAFDIYVTQTPNLQRPDYRGVVRALGPARVP